MAENVAPAKTSKSENSEDVDVDVCTIDTPKLCSIVPTSAEKYAGAKPSPSNILRKRSLEASEEDDCDSDPVSRKEKSLGKLCQKFLAVMQEEESKGHDIHLETVAKSMNVEKRRIYDIVNVMEALDAMAKTNKSYYRWHGLRKLPQLMATLQRQAADEGLPQRVAHVEQAMCNFTEIKRRSSGFSSDVVGSLVAIDDKEPIIPESPGSSQSSMSAENFAASQKSRVNRDRYGQNSLANLCRRFLMVLLCNPKSGGKVSLDVASTVLIKDPETEGFEPPSRSRCRRLYDIANVLVAMNLIKKVHYLFGTKKIPLFVYCGPAPDESGLDWNTDICSSSLSVSPPPAKRQSLCKLTELADVAERERKLLEATRSQGSTSPLVNDENTNPLIDLGLPKPTPKQGAYLLTEANRGFGNPFRTLSNRLSTEETVRVLMGSQANIVPLKPLSTVWKQVGFVNRSSLADRSQSSNQLPLSPIYQIHNPTNASAIRFAPRKSYPLSIPVMRPKQSAVSHSVSNILGVRNQNSANCN